MRYASLPLILAGCVVTIGLACSGARGQGVTILVDPITGSGVVNGRLSANGNRVAGILPPGLGIPDHVATWTQSSGLYDITAHENNFFSSAGTVRVSGNGNVIAGDFGRYWSGPSTGHSIGGLTSAGATPLGVNADGSVIVGYDYFQNDTIAYRWTASGGYQALPFYQAWDCSADGNAVLGFIGGFSSGVWHADSGTTQPLGAVPGAGAFSYPGPRGLNADGTIVVGNAGNYAALWYNGVGQNLGLLPGWDTSHAYAVSSDGQVIVGQAGDDRTGRASIWTPSTGGIFATDYLASFGVTIPAGWTLDNAIDVSDDGRTILFEGFSRNTGSLVFADIVVTIPTPAPAIVFIAFAALSSHRRDRKIPAPH